MVASPRTSGKLVTWVMEVGVLAAAAAAVAVGVGAAANAVAVGVAVACGPPLPPQAASSMTAVIPAAATQPVATAGLLTARILRRQSTVMACPRSGILRLRLIRRHRTHRHSPGQTIRAERRAPGSGVQPAAPVILVASCILPPWSAA